MCEATEQLSSAMTQSRSTSRKINTSLSKQTF